jgi:hypothetical protein
MMMVDALGSPLPSSQGVRCRCFLALMVGAPGSIAPTPPRGPVIDVCYIDGGRSWISISTSQGAHCRCFLTLMVGAPRSPAPTSPTGLTVDVFSVDGGPS